MRALLQRVSQASVSIDGKMISEIRSGFLILLGIADTDTDSDLEYLSKKIPALRVFPDAGGKMNLSLLDVKGEALVVSQFTLIADTEKGNRPSFFRAARPEKAIPYYERFIEHLKASGVSTCAGVFGADMQVALVNDGPVTILLDSREDGSRD